MVYTIGNGKKSNARGENEDELRQEDLALMVIIYSYPLNIITMMFIITYVMDLVSCRIPGEFGHMVP